jgi:hypothetical protein
MVGTINECDPNNRINFYEYDEYQRVILIRDLDKNILKKFCYNYHGQTENCNVSYNSQQQMTFQKQCSPGYTGSNVTYVIPQGTYVSTVSVAEANQQATNDLLANGQDYANALGSCTVAQVPLSSLNNTGASGFNAVYTNVSTGQQYSFSISSVSGMQTLGLIPAGTYNISISKPGNNVKWVFSVYSDSTCNMSVHYAKSATFFNIVISSSISCNGVQMDPL